MSDAAVTTATTETTQTDSTPKVDAIDAALASALEKEGQPLVENDGSPVAKGPVRGAGGKFVSTKKTEVAAPADDAGGAETVVSDAATQHSDDDIKKAMAAAKRDDSPKKTLKAIEDGDEDTIAHYLKRAKVQTAGDEFSTKHKTLQQELDTFKKAATTKAEAQVDATASQANLDEAVKPLASYLAETIGDDKAAEHIRTSFAAIEKSITERFTRENSQQVDALNKKIEAMEIERARDALITEWPEAKARELWQEALALRPDFPITERRPDVATQMDHILRHLVLPDRDKTAQADRERRNKARDNGSPTATARAGAAKPSGTQAISALQDEYLEAAERGDENRVKEIRAELKSRLSHR